MLPSTPSVTTAHPVAPTPDHASSVSVVLAVRNGAPYLQAARRQLEALTSAPAEIVVVDDASDDGSAALLDAWEREDATVRVLRLPARSGVAAARNYALEHVRGRWVWFVDCDDRWEPDIVERMATTAVTRGADVVCCQAATEHEDGRPGPLAPRSGASAELDGDAAVRALLRGALRGNLWNKLFARHLVDQVRFPATWSNSDLGAMADLLVRARRVVVVDDVLYTYVLHPTSIIGSGAGGAHDLLTVLERVSAATLRMADRTGVDDDLRAFAFREVYLPTLHRQFRRGRLDADDLAVRAEIRRRVTPGATWSVAVHGDPVVAAAALSAARAGALHERAYRTLRRRRVAPVVARPQPVRM